MPKLMLVVSAEMKNIALLQPRAGSDDTTINYFFKIECEQCGWVSGEEVRVSLGVKEKPTAGSRRRSYNNASLRCDGCERSGVITLIPGYGNPLSHYHCREVGLMLFDCDGLIPVNYAFNGGWLAVTTSGQEIHVDLGSGGYRNVIDGEEVKITNLEAKFVPEAEIVPF